METQGSHFNRSLVLALVLLFALTLAVVVLPMLSSSPGSSGRGSLLGNTLLFSIPLGLLYGSIYALLRAWHEHSIYGVVNSPLARFIQWAPRWALGAIAIFLGLFSLDVFGEGNAPLELLSAFLLHNIPSILLLLLLVLAWKRPVVGFVAFLLVAAASPFLFLRGSYNLSNLLLFVVLFLLVAAFFYADWKWLRPARP